MIPARGGSKGIPGKNLQEVAGRSLVDWALDVAGKSPVLDRTIVSSDSEEIIGVANSRGDYAPFVRPAELARDNTPSLPVFQHALEWAEKEDGCEYAWMVVLEPPCPFRLPAHIDGALELAAGSNASSVMSLVEVSDHHPVRIKKLMDDGRVKPFCIPEPEGLRRQDQDPAYIRNEAVYIFARDTIKAGRLWGDDPYGYEMDRRYYAINIDEPADLAAAAFLYEQLESDGQLNLIDARAL